MYLLCFLIFSLTSIHSVAGTVCSISSYKHPENNKSMFFLGTKHMESTKVKPEQLDEIRKIISEAKLLQNQGKPVEFIIEGSDLGVNDLFNDVRKELENQAIIFSSLDSRHFISHILDKLDEPNPEVPESIDDILTFLKKPIEDLQACSKAHGRIAQLSLKEFANFVEDINEELQGFSKDFKISLLELKMSPISSLCQRFQSQIIADFLTVINDIYVKTYLLSQDAIDVFDAKSLIKVMDLPDEGIIFHIAGSSHKDFLQKELIVLGFQEVMNIECSNMSETDSMVEEKISRAVAKKFGDDISEEFFGEVMSYVQDKKAKISAKCSSLYAVDIGAFESIRNYLINM